MTWNYTGKESAPDKKTRVSLGFQTKPGVRYRIAQNELGQVLLDPVKTVPAYEAWIYENQDRINSIRLGIKQAEAGEVVQFDLSELDDDSEVEDE